MKLYRSVGIIFFVFIMLLIINYKDFFGFPTLNGSSHITPENKTFLRNKEIRLHIIAPLHTNNLPFFLMISGDGGWTNFDQLLAESFGNKGIRVVGLDARKYFWRPKTPENTTTDIANILDHYQKLWHTKAFILVGYSFGADVVPFVANRLNPRLKKSLQAVFALSPDLYTDFEVRILTLLHLKKSKKYDVTFELKQIKPIRPIVFFGSKENPKLPEHFKAQGIETIILTGNHHFDYNYEAISTSLFEIITKK